ncbi:MAG: helix-turn-helix transcriptional regulator [Clostridia bacterium]|nr:helix-turn-helix transcriptional regulator [Clostridia bacterium]
MLSLLNMLPFHDREIQSANKTFDSILSFVNRNYMNNITLSEIASACSCSESTVSHLFKLHTGISAQKYIINLRLKQAEKLLSTSSLPITEIAFLCGFNNSNYFSTVFKKAKGISPSDYSKSQ